MIIRYEAFHDGKPVKGVKADAYPLDLGSANLMPEFEAAVTGMKAGEEKEVEINFPADYPDKDIAGKKLLFKVLVKEVKEKKLPELGDEFAKDVGFENMEKLRLRGDKGAGKGKRGAKKGRDHRADSELPARQDGCPRAREAACEARGDARAGGAVPDEDRHPQR